MGGEGVSDFGIWRLVGEQTSILFSSRISNPRCPLLNGSFSNGHDRVRVKTSTSLGEVENLEFPPPSAEHSFWYCSSHFRDAVSR